MQLSNASIRLNQYCLGQIDYRFPPVAMHLIGLVGLSALPCSEHFVAAPNKSYPYEENSDCTAIYVYMNTAKS